MHLRSGGTKVHAGPGSPADADVPATRRSSRHRSSSAKYRLETSDEEADAQPPAKRQLALLDTGQVGNSHSTLLLLVAAIRDAM